MTAVTTTRGVGKGFGSPAGRVGAVRDVDLQVGGIFGFPGPDEAGKTTTLRMLTMLLPVDPGSAVVAGHDVGRAPAEVRRRRRAPR